MIEQPSPQDPEDGSRPVVLQEPRRDGKGDALPSGGGLQPPADAALHPGWAKVLSPADQVLWHGQSDQTAPTSLLMKPGVLVAIGALALFGILESGASPGLLLVVGVWLLYLRRQRRRVLAAADLHYLLTNRAAYIARRYGSGLTEIAAYPITSAMDLRLGPRAVSFGTKPGPKGRPEPVGFQGIPDAAAVHGLMQALLRQSERG